MQHILLIDDDERLAELLARYFEQYDLSLSHATHPSRGLQLLDTNQFDLVILDIMLPEMDGFDVCKRIRQQSDIPIIMLTARGDVMDRVVGLELGADDYIPKPFEPRELVARIHSNLKRIGNKIDNNKLLKYGELTINTDNHSITLANHAINVTNMEYQLIALLARHPGKVFSRDEILNQLKGIDADIYSRSVDILISRVRQKLKPSDYIKTARGSGYYFVGKPL